MYTVKKEPKPNTFRGPLHPVQPVLETRVTLTEGLGPENSKTRSV